MVIVELVPALVVVVAVDDAIGALYPLAVKALSPFTKPETDTVNVGLVVP
ncbi:hypothetical protein SDC9_187765 [bioreactor metagenome]|uniref:Uncharacterized protein n=1 Tax=bioreactor metagenome TaxID=1076179 RepID=A0A645HPQ4_9ZZZZ